MFIESTAKSSGVPAAEIRAWLDQAKYQQSIINAITKPAEGKPWRDYRPIFLTDKRIADGRAFLAQNRDELLRIQARTGVPPEYVTAIIGVETFYGGNTGSYRVLDALYTLGFFYPKREEFFRGELAQLFQLAREEHLDLNELRGSYAGAMGYGQFIRRATATSPSTAMATAGATSCIRRATRWPRSPTTSRNTAGSPGSRWWRGRGPTRTPRRSCPTRSRRSTRWKTSRPRLPRRRAGAAAAGDAGDARGRGRHRALARLQQLLRDHPLQPLAAVCDGGAPAGAGDRGAMKRLAPALLLVLAACAGNPKKPSSSAEALADADRARAEALAPSSRALDDACAPTRVHRDSDYTRGGLYAPGVADGRPAREIDVSGVAEPEARREPRAATGNRSPYTVLGKVYRVRDDADGYVERGVASWYGTKFNGRATSSGELYDICRFTAAHKTCRCRRRCASPTSTTAAACSCASTTAARSTTAASST
jgi:hypothetical protein